MDTITSLLSSVGLSLGAQPDDTAVAPMRPAGRSASSPFENAVVQAKDRQRSRDSSADSTAGFSLIDFVTVNRSDFRASQISARSMTASPEPNANVYGSTRTLRSASKSTTASPEPAARASRSASGGGSAASTPRSVESGTGSASRSRSRSSSQDRSQGSAEKSFSKAAWKSFELFRGLSVYSPSLPTSLFSLSLSLSLSLSHTHTHWHTYTHIAKGRRHDQVPKQDEGAQVQVRRHHHFRGICGHHYVRVVMYTFSLVV
jgi:hypothetical protein